MEVNVHCFCLLGLDLLVDDAIRHEVICLYLCGWLFVSHFVQDNADVYYLSCCFVKCCKFCLIGQGHDVLDYVRHVEDGSIVGLDISVVGEKKWLRFVEVASAAVDSEGCCAD